jgi:hypothetical protein
MRCERPMRTTLLAAAMLLGALAAAAPARAQNYPWCAEFADGAGVNCGFSTYQQCMATSMGSGGACTPNNQYKPAASAAPARQPARKHRTAKNS